MASREFELAELKLLVDAVQSSRFITPKKSRSLISVRTAGDFHMRTIYKARHSLPGIKMTCEAGHSLPGIKMTCEAGHSLPGIKMTCKTGHSLSGVSLRNYQSIPELKSQEFPCRRSRWSNRRGSRLSRSAFWGWFPEKSYRPPDCLSSP